VYRHPLQRQIGKELSDKDLYTFDWYILLERVNGIYWRIVTSKKPE